MNHRFLYMGLITLLLVAAAILTRPNEEDYDTYLETKQGIVCSEQAFTCVEESSGEKLQLVETKLQNRVFFLLMEKEFVRENKQSLRMKAVGLFGTFLSISAK